MERLIEVVQSRSILAALFASWAWPRFSVTSFLIARRLRSLGIEPTFVIDVGANDGQFAVAMLRTFPSTRLVAFEPQVPAFERLRRHLAGVDRAECMRLALGAHGGEAVLHLTSDDRSSSLRPLGEAHMEAFPRTEPRGTETVPIRPLDEVVEAPSEGVTLLKLDVQGFESDVLRGASGTLASTDWVLMECSFRPMYVGEAVFTDLVELMSENGFELFGVIDVLRSRDRQIVVQADALYRKVRD